MKLRGERVVLREIKEQNKKSIILVGNEEVKPFVKGEVVAVGDKVKDIKVKQTVLVNRQMSGLVDWNGEMLWLVLEEEIIAAK